jgi:hypothetical protein
MDLKTQKPAQGISCTGIWDDARSFRVGCECTDPDHDVNMWIEVNRDDEVRDVEVGFYVEGTSPHWAKGWNRFRAAWAILTRGYHRAEHHLLLKPQAALNMADAIKTSVETLSKTKSVK